MRDKRPLPIGVSDFKEIIEENYYYADKTALISDILYERAKVNLFVTEIFKKRKKLSLNLNKSYENKRKRSVI